MANKTAQEMADWLIGQTILGVEGDGENLKVIFAKGYMEIDGDDFEVYVSTTD